MSKEQDFKEAIISLEKEWVQSCDEIEEYASDINNWCLVHATKYMPLKNKNGDMFIPTTAMATNYKIPRSTVHTTLNHVVTSHGGGNWDAMPFVFFTPYKDVVQQNEKPLEVSMFDTYFAPDPDHGLILPKSTYTVRPSNDCLYKIGPTEATYKEDYFTTQEIDLLLECMDIDSDYSYDKYTYQELLPADEGNTDEHHVAQLLGFDQRLINIYSKTKDKKAFLHGILEEDRITILTKFLRNKVAQIAMRKQGYRYLTGSDCGVNATAIEKAALKNGLKATCCNKGHSGSIFAETENTHLDMYELLERLYKCEINAKQIYDTIVHYEYSKDFAKRIAKAILKTGKIDCYDFYHEQFLISQEYSGTKIQNIKEYNAALDTTLKRNAVIMSNQFAQWLEKLKQSPEYKKLCIKMRSQRTRTHFYRQEKEL